MILILWLKRVLIQLDLGHICRLPSKHELATQLIVLVLRLLLVSTGVYLGIVCIVRLLDFLLQIFDSISIPQRVESMLTARVGR